MFARNRSRRLLLRNKSHTSVPGIEAGGISQRFVQLLERVVKFQGQLYQPTDIYSHFHLNGAYNYCETSRN
jgi:hypothetical protein